MYNIEKIIGIYHIDNLLSTHVNLRILIQIEFVVSQNRFHSFNSFSKFLRFLRATHLLNLYKLDSLAIGKFHLQLRYVDKAYKFVSVSLYCAIYL